MGYAEVSVTSTLLASSSPIVSFNTDLEDPTVPLVYTIWLETADGNNSTSAIFTAL